MPIYEYRCLECGKISEELVTGGRDAPIPCASCGSGRTEKIMSVIGGISVGGSSPSLPCGDSCAGAPACAASGGGCCPHAH
jgi:putative FmdB family regulatory protein